MEKTPARATLKLSRDMKTNYFRGKAGTVVTVPAAALPSLLDLYPGAFEVLGAAKKSKPKPMATTAVNVEDLETRTTDTEPEPKPKPKRRRARKPRSDG